jgi:hypothetical protein
MIRKIALVTAFCVAIGGAAFADEPAPPRFARDVQPLLRRHCLKCHGPAKREGGLNLSTPAGIVRGGKTGAALVPHDVNASRLWTRVAEEEMPPDKPLADNEKELLRQWIAAGAPGLPARETAGGGAEGKDHWAFQPLNEVNLPAVRDGTKVRTPIDRFIQAALEEEQLTIGPEADRRTLIRRVSFDLTGLPPTPQEIAAFVNDHAEIAYANMVERYLASPHYGERWGKYWLDSAGYADSNGYFNADSDRPLAWRYRDWVVRAFNRDLPFDHFVRAQLAGDELAGPLAGNDAPPEAIELLEATHYLRNGQDGSGESDGNPDEVRADRYYAIESVILNVTNSLLGLTIQCAKCHDHKFEPLTQRDYYQMQAVFAPAFNLQQWVKPNDRFIYASLPGEFEKWESQVKTLDAQLVGLRKDLAEWVTQNHPRGEPLFADSFDGPNSRLADRWSNTAPGDNAPGGAVPVNIDSAEAPGLIVHDGRLRIIEEKTQGDSWVSTREKFDWTPDEVGAAIQVTFDLIDDRLDESGAHSERIGYFIALHDFNDDSPVAGGNILIDGHPGGPTAVDFDYPGADAKQIGLIGGTGYKPGRNFGVRITHIESGKFKLEHLVDFLPDGKSLELAAADLPDGGFGFEYCCNRSFVVDNVLVERFHAGAEMAAAQERFRKELEAKKKPIDEAQQLRSGLNERPGKIAWVSDVSETPPEVFLLERGDYGKPSAKVEPAGPVVLSDDRHSFVVQPPSSPSKTTGRRLAFANWVTASGSAPAALLARVQVNRLWQHHFATGIVATPDNLGLTGAAPSHPELLDWLAHEFASPANVPPLRKGGEGGVGDVVSEAATTNSSTPPNPPLQRKGIEAPAARGRAWSIKRVHRLILNSTAYRQIGRDDERGKLKDPDNRLLWRFPVRRLDAEAIRDALLAVSGDLDSRLGGPAVSTKRNDTGEVVAADAMGAGRRRSIYLRQRRTEMVSFLTVFDAPSIVFNSVQRAVSTMPLQALALLNSDFVVERAKSFSARLEREAGDEAARIRLAHLVAWGRDADMKDFESARAFLESQTGEYRVDPNPRARAWIDFCQMLLASNEFLYVE